MSAYSCLVTISEDGELLPRLEPWEHPPLDHGLSQQRFLTLLPCTGDKSGYDSPVRCKMTVEPLSHAGPFIAITNARGYRLFHDVIEIDGHAHFVSKALEVFLRHFRRADEPVRIWVRYICLNFGDAEERSLYWNRPFIDSMYGAASDVTDMSEYLSDLMDHNAIASLRDQACYPAQKDWGSSGQPLWMQSSGEEEHNDQKVLVSIEDGLAANQQLPNVYPIWLGSKLSNEKPNDTFRYLPLDRVADEIRLVVVECSEDPSAPLVLHLAHCPLYSPCDFYALSYTWGQPGDEREVIFAGQLLRVRSNLWRALRFFRRPDKAIVIWIDALCINQNDVKERDRQLTRMGDIYYQAKRVICYTGDSDESTGAGLELANHLHMPTRYYDGVVEKFDDLPARCAALLRYCNQPYFERIWILQEISMASSPTVFCGAQRGIELEQLAKAALHLSDMLRIIPDLSKSVQPLAPEVQDPDEICARVRMSAHLRRLHMGDAYFWGGFMGFQTGEDSPGYLEVAILLRSFKATVASDKLFALWNLARDKEGLELTMRYDRSTQESFTAFAVAWARQKGRLDVIGASEYSERRLEGTFYTKAPSWCADWSVPSNVSSLVRQDTLPRVTLEFMFNFGGALYSADGDMEQKTDAEFFEIDEKCLVCVGAILDSIDLRYLNLVEGQLYSRKQLFAAMKTEYTRLAPAIYQDLDQAICAMVHGDAIQAWHLREDQEKSEMIKREQGDTAAAATEEQKDEDEEKEKGSEPSRAAEPEGEVEEEDYDEKYVCRPFTSTKRRIERRRPDESRFIWSIGSEHDYSRFDAGAANAIITRGRVPVLTTNGYICLMPAGLFQHIPKRGILLAILATCSVPVALMESEEQPGSYLFLGTCFVQGWMDGEMVEDGDETAPEFWRRMAEKERMRII